MDLQDATRPIKIGQVLNATFALIRDRPFAVFSVALCVTLPIRLWLYFLPSLAVALTITSYAAAYAFAGVSAWLIAGVMFLLGQGALIGTALAKSECAPAGFLKMSLPVIRRAPALIAVALLRSLGILLGLVCLIVPGVMLYLMWSVVGPVAVAERTGIVEAFRRSQALTDDTLSQVFLLILTGGLGCGAFTWVARKLAQLILGLGHNGLDSPFVAGPFLVGSLIDLLKTAFYLALVCSLYVALIQRDGGGPMHQRLNRIFA